MAVVSQAHAEFGECPRPRGLHRAQRARLCTPGPAPHVGSPVFDTFACG
eukprot:CAMPEP_0171107900 /NCGR_PEP_ID=MMETSP0766_2-20121228/67772_1 /TAXON_ID=439317 /ORGANISM="Gambierdiscus australes, Strain CAWD 149" /LENGTH=48 /DNA_ID= /DNA_START= /DNA_END= /DNA_ORIENTATION=